MSVVCGGGKQCCTCKKFIASPLSIFAGMPGQLHLSKQGRLHDIDTIAISIVMIL